MRYWILNVQNTIFVMFWHVNMSKTWCDRIFLTSDSSSTHEIPLEKYTLISIKKTFWLVKSNRAEKTECLVRLLCAWNLFHIQPFPLTMVICTHNKEIIFTDGSSENICLYVNQRCTKNGMQNIYNILSPSFRYHPLNPFLSPCSYVTTENKTWNFLLSDVPTTYY